MTLLIPEAINGKIRYEDISQDLVDKVGQMIKNPLTKTHLAST
jgi:hypothetical protein